MGKKAVAARIGDVVMAAAFVSMIDSITNLPVESKTTVEIVAWRHS